MSLFEQSVHRTSDGRVFIWLAPAGSEQYSHDPGLHLTMEPCTDHFRISLGLEILDDDGRLHVHAKLPFTRFFTAGFGAGPVFSSRVRSLFRIPKYESRTISLSTMDGSLFWNLWANPDSWSSTDPWWKSGVLDPIDKLFGRAERTRHVKLSSTRFTIKMPEGDYPATVTLHRSEFTRPRWPFRLGPLHVVVMSGHVEVEKGIPFPGKGESDYDIGDDALYSWDGPADSLEDAIGKTIASALNTRRKRSGTYWFGKTKPDASFQDYDGDTEPEDEDPGYNYEDDDAEEPEDGDEPVTDDPGEASCGEGSCG